MCVTVTQALSVENFEAAREPGFACLRPSTTTSFGPHRTFLVLVLEMVAEKGAKVSTKKSDKKAEKKVTEKKAVKDTVSKVAAKPNVVKKGGVPASSKQIIAKANVRTVLVSKPSNANVS